MTTCYIARSSQVAARMIGGEMMIMSAKDSTLFNLNEVASAIWNAADGATPLAEIVQHAVCSEYEVPPPQAIEEAEAFVHELSEHGILMVSGQPIAGAPK